MKLRPSRIERATNSRSSMSLIGIHSPGCRHQRQFRDRRHSSRVDRERADEEHADIACRVPEIQCWLKPARHLTVQAVIDDEGLVRHVFDDHPEPAMGGRNSLELCDQQHELV
jgi:hypothetical protein